MTALIDNDVLLKSACYRLLDELITANCDTVPIGYLAAARFVLLKRIRRASLQGDPNVVEAELLGFLGKHEAVETTPKEQVLAATLETAAQNIAVNLDTGESQLVAVLVLRALPRLLTGDKRAIIAIDRLIDPAPEIGGVVGTVTCLEQLVKRALVQSDAVAIRTAVCDEPSIDRTLSICFGCLGSGQPLESILQGLDSYISDLRRQAPRVLST
jgi:hypothetical protein